MSFIETMNKRYTTKMYDPTKKIESSKIEELKEILRMSPSSINSQPWKFTFVQDKETKAKLADASFFNKNSVNNCDTFIVFSAIDNLDLFQSQIEEHLPEGAVNYYNTLVKPQGEVAIKRWFEKQVYLSLGIFLSACAEMGIDSTPMEGIEAAKFDAILNSTDYRTLVAVAIGYKSVEDANQPEKKPKSRMKINQVIDSI